LRYSTITPFAAGCFWLGLSAAAFADPLAPISYNWSGIYAGGNVGYSWGRATNTYNEPAFAGPPAVGLPTSFSTSQQLNGAIGGFQFGYNVQGNSPWVGGFETDFQWSGERGSSSFSGAYVIPPPPIPIPDTLPATAPGDPLVNGTFKASIQWFGTVRGRLGVLITPTAFVYGTGGFAYGQIKSSGTITDAGPPAAWSFGATTINFGWTLGAGIEGAFPNSPDWTWKVEYLYIDFGRVSGTGFDTDFGGPFNWSTNVTDNIVRGGFNYRFH
jgi:outer membrane immunogenic protein